MAMAIYKEKDRAMTKANAKAEPDYSINKGSEAFVQPEDETDCSDAHKRTVSSLMETLASEGHDVEALWRQIGLHDRQHLRALLDRRCLQHQFFSKLTPPTSRAAA